MLCSSGLHCPRILSKESFDPFSERNKNLPTNFKRVMTLLHKIHWASSSGAAAFAGSGSTAEGSHGKVCTQGPVYAKAFILGPASQSACTYTGTHTHTDLPRKLICFSVHVCKSYPTSARLGSGERSGHGTLHMQADPYFLIKN